MTSHSTLNTILNQVIALLRNWQLPAWLVGGTVRDSLLDRPAHDIDLVVPNGGLRLAQALADTLGAAYFPLDSARDVGRVVLRLADGTRVDIDVARLREPTLEDDLFARDFSINAMAQDVHDLDLRPIDPVGGIADLHDRRLRMASPHAFEDDPVRIVRGVRLAQQLDLTWEPATHALAQEAAPRLDTVAGERVREELARILGAPSASQGVHKLDEMGALAVLLPEVHALHGIMQHPPHQLDVYDHTLAVVDGVHALLAYLALRPGEEDAGRLAAAQVETQHALGMMVRAGFDVALAGSRDDLVDYLNQSAEQGYARRDLLPWAALLHDIAKPHTRHVQADGRLSFEGHEAASAVMARAVLQRLRFSGTAIQQVTRMCATHDQPGALARTSGGTPDRRAIFRYFKTTRPVGIETALLSLADHLAAWGPALRPERWSSRVQLVSHLLDANFHHHDELVAPKPLLDGHMLLTGLHLRPGPAVGTCLNALQEEQAAGTVTTMSEAWVFIQTFMQQHPL